MADRQMNGGRLLSGEEREELEGVVADYRGDHLTEEECHTCRVLAGLLARDVDAADSPDEPEADRLSYADLEAHAAALQAQVDSLKASIAQSSGWTIAEIADECKDMGFLEAERHFRFIPRLLGRKNEPVPTEGLPEGARWDEFGAAVHLRCGGIVGRLSHGAVRVKTAATDVMLRDDVAAAVAAVLARKGSDPR